MMQFCKIRLIIILSGVTTVLIAIYKCQPKSSSHDVIFSEDFDSLKSLNIDDIISKISELISLHIEKKL